jgi:hypothetical protein
MKSFHVVVQYIEGWRILPLTIASGDVLTTQPLNEARILGIDEFKFSIEPAKKFHPEMDILASKALEIFHALRSIIDAIIVLGSSWPWTSVPLNGLL